jgi:site-specific recombinase XerD
MNSQLFFAFTNDFLNRYLPLQVCRSAHTIESYRDALTLFRRFVVNVLKSSLKKFTFANCTKDVVLSFIEELQSAGMSAGTCNQRLAALKAYLWYAADKDVAVQSVALAISHIPPVKGQHALREKLSSDALRAILHQPNPYKKIGARDRAMMALLYDSAIRLSELLSLTVGDVHLETGDSYIFIQGKGRKERVVAITEATTAHLRAHISKYHCEPNTKINSTLFFTTTHGVRHPMSASNVERFIQRYADQARLNCPEIPKEVYPHMFRRTRATDLYQSGVPLELISRILGHSSIETTRIYASASLEIMREAMSGAIDTLPKEEPLWKLNEDELARLCGLR